ncbi:MAG: hypothetical protein F7B18_04085 [Desulfurococcales archaeon]|nr:hypothetical protein [Desulfurococcales archaeon]
MGLRGLAELALVDSSDSLRPPGFDVMMVIIASLGAALATMQPISEPHVAARIILDPTLFAATLFLALRGSAGVAGLIQRGIVSIYLSYPVSRHSVYTAIVVSRVLLPAATLLSAPLLVAGLVLLPVVSVNPGYYILVFLAYLLQASMYGSFFLLAGLAAKSPGTASVVSITFYFAYNITMLILSAVGAAMGSNIVSGLADAMAFYYMVYRSLLGVGVEVWQLLLVPLLLLAMLLAGYVYFTRRFEPG